MRGKIGELAVANDFVTKAQALGRDARRGMVEPGHQKLPIGKQCKLLSISRSSFYYTPKGETVLNLALMRQIDEQFLETPFFGVRPPLRHSSNALPGTVNDLASAQRRASAARQAMLASLRGG